MQPGNRDLAQQPTGDVAPLDFVAALCDACPGMVMVDEAYVEFADDSFGAATTAQGLIAEHPNLVILHTLSKAFGAPARVWAM
ncbi:MAG: aminotransferase class I/II-fold pyridoxal phosphate-dependent enzyme [Collinsella sp.]